MTSRRLIAALAAVALIAFAALAAGLAGGPGPRADATPAQLTAQPVLGVGADGVRPFGVAADGTAWAWGSASGARPSGTDGAPIPVGDDGFLLLRGRGGSWRPTQGALAPDGTVLDRFTPAGGNGPGAGRVTPGGGVAVAGFSGTRFVLLTGRAGEPLREVADPQAAAVSAAAAAPAAAGAPPAPASAAGLAGSAGGLAATTAGAPATAGGQPADGRAITPRAAPEPLLLPGESPASSSRVAIAAVDEPGGTGVFLGVTGAVLEPAVLHWSGAAWSREPVELPAGSSGAFRILALAGTSADRVWMLAQPDDALGRGLVLFARDTSGASARWVERPLGATPFATRATPALGLTGVQAVRYPAQGITASPAGVWLDGTWRQGTRAGSVTVYYDIAAGTVTGSWCDAVKPDGSPVCTGQLGSDLSAAGGRGYRSFAWAGRAFGERVITDAVLPGAASRGTLGTWLRFAGSDFVRQPGAGASASEPTGGAFASLDEGWLAGSDDLVHVTAQPEPMRLDRVQLAFRRPLLAVAGEPGKTPGAAGAIAVGADGTVARYTPDNGWQPEFLLASSGKRATPTLRGVAWPEPGIAYAVGDNGELWEWRSTTGLWQRDGGRPVDLDAQLTGVAFRPGDPYTGYVVGRGGTLLRSGLGWEQETLPEAVRGDDLLAVTFAGRDALVVARRQVYDGGSIRRSSALLINDGSGWRVDQGAQRLLDAGGPAASLTAVAGLPDGGAVAAGAGIVLVRDSATSPWRLTRDPIGGVQAVAAAAVREGDRVAAVLSVSRDTTFLDDDPDDLAPPTPDLPVPLLRPLSLPPEGALIRETADGWRDEEHASFRLSGPDWPGRAETIAALLLDAGGNGWAVGGNTGGELGRGAGPGARAQGQTAAIFRYPGTSAPAAGVAASAPPTTAGPLRLAVAGGATCEEACADLARQTIGPDRMLAAALAQASAMGKATGGPRAFLYTGGRVSAPGGLSLAEAQRFADLAARSTIPFYPALSVSEQGAGAASFQSAFAGFAAPLGAGPLPPRVDDSGIPGAPALGGARTHYGFDIAGPEGTLRVLVIDNSAGSLAASDAHQNPGEPQERWLRSALRAARDRGIAAIVVGNRDLSRSLAPEANRASDGDAVAQLLVDEGASAYFFDRPDENRSAPIPTGGATTIPSFGTGSLGYGPQIVQKGAPFYGESGLLLAEVNLAARDRLTNRAPVSTRLIPVIEDLRVDAVDGALLRRSRPALFTALARRPRAGTRRPQSPGDPLPDPYVPIPPAPVAGSALVGRIEPEFSFTSSDPDIGNFVAVDPTSSNPRDVLLGADDKPVADSRSGLFCAFNAGTTTITVRTGGLAYSQKVSIQAGSVDRPCGTVPLSAARFTAGAAAAATPPPAPAPAPAAASSPPPPVPPPPTVVPPAAKAPSPRPTPAPPFFGGLYTPAPGEVAAPPVLPPVPPPGFFANPIPPGGATVRVQEEEREEEIAPESSSASAVAYEPDTSHVVRDALGTLFAVLLLAAFGAAGMSRRRRRPRHRAAHAFARETPRSTYNRDHHRRFQ